MPTPAILQTFIRLAYRQFIVRHTAHGLISWRYLLPRQNALIRLHRQFWWQTPSKLPRALWLLLELLLWLRWIGWYAWRDSWKVSRSQHSQVEPAHRLTQTQLFLHLLKLSLAHGMVPGVSCHHQLYRSGSNPWAYLFPNECAAFHRWRDANSHPTAIKTLADKHSCSRQFAELGIAATTNLAMLPKGSREPDWSQFPLPAFLKPRYGSAGQHCFYLRRSEAGAMQWQEYEQPPHHSTQAWQAWKVAAAKNDFLLQTCHTNAPALDIIHPELITLRVLSTCAAGQCRIELAYLEIPDGIKHYQIQPLDLETGQLILLPHIKSNRAQQHWQPAQLYLLPHWAQAARSALCAHAALAPDLFGVAWDFILSQEGALLLEGNTTWGTGAWQTVRGPLLAKYANGDYDQ